MTTLSQFLSAKFSTAILKYPTGEFGIVGSIPYALTHERPGHFGPVRVSNSWNTEQEAIDALLAIGIKDFQLSDCSWYHAE